jgi:hypothetical protein
VDGQSSIVAAPAVDQEQVDPERAEVILRDRPRMAPAARAGPCTRREPALVDLPAPADVPVLALHALALAHVPVLARPALAWVAQAV